MVNPYVPPASTIIHVAALATVPPQHPRSFQRLLHLGARRADGRGADRSCAPFRKADALAVAAKDAMLLLAGF